MSALSATEQAALESFENESSKGESVIWDTPKTISGVVAREIENVTYSDKQTGEEVTKRVCTLRTSTGLVSIWEGPVSLTSKLFDGEYSQDEPPMGPPGKGDLVIITYKGEVMAQSGKEYKAFSLQHKSAAAVNAGTTTPQRADSAQLGPDDDLPY